MNTIITILIIIFMFFIGTVTQAYKKLYSLITKIVIFIINRILKIKDFKIDQATQYRKQLEGIKKVKRSKVNLKPTGSINIIALVIFLTSLTAIIVNLNQVSGNAISNLLYSMLKWLPFFKNAIDVNTFFTAITFSTLSYGATQLLNTWNKTKDLRKIMKIKKLKEKALSEFSTEELYNEAIKKNMDKINKLIEGD